jgi:two-component system sensor histidine kinase KdpD
VLAIVSRLSRGHALHALAAIALVAGLTFAMLPFRERLDKAHVALIYMLAVLILSARAGRTVGASAAVFTFLLFNFLFLPPYHTFFIADPLHWLVLLTYLLTAGIAAQLFHTARQQTEAARERAAEIERLSTLGAETLSVGRAEDALGAIVNVIRNTLHVAVGEVYLKDPREDEPRLVVSAPRLGETERPEVPALVKWVASSGRGAAELVGGTTRLQESGPDNAAPPLDMRDTRVLLLPLRVRERTVGVLRLVGHDVIPFDPAQQQFLEALSYYAALGVERVRLTTQAEHAAALAEADRLKDALLATVSHDLRTPLTTIKATAQDIAASGDARGRAIEIEANRLNALVADLLDLSRLQSGAVRLEPQVNDAADLIGAALQQLEGTLRDRKVNVVIEPADSDLLGQFDFVHSLRVLVNLIENAHKYSPPGAAIDMGARRDGSVLVFSVADRGPGIPNAERHLIYQPFFRSQHSSAGVSGTGMGLAIATRLAELQGGVVRHLAREGGGTVFVYRVPAVDAPRPAAPATS